MGAAKRKKERFFAEHPICCFCGGNTPATTIDHIPGINLFKNKARVAGFEFPACEPCNALTRNTEQVVALLARTRLAEDNDKDTDFERLIRAVRNNVPSVYYEIMAGRISRRSDRKAIARIIGHQDFELAEFGEQCRLHCELFGAKLGMALHYEIFGDVMPPCGGVFFTYQNQHGLLLNGFPQLDIPFGNFSAMRAGKLSSEFQFEYRFATIEGKKTAAVQALLQRNILYNMATTNDRSPFRKLTDWHIPGHLLPVNEPSEPTSLSTMIEIQFPSQSPPPSPT